MLKKIESDKWRPQRHLLAFNRPKRFINSILIQSLRLNYQIFRLSWNRYLLFRNDRIYRIQIFSTFGKSDCHTISWVIIISSKDFPKKNFQLFQHYCHSPLNCFFNFLHVRASFFGNVDPPMTFCRYWNLESSLAQFLLSLGKHYHFICSSLPLFAAFI